MSFAQRYARIYQYSLSDKFFDASDQQANVEHLTKTRERAAVSAPVTNSATDAFIDFCKSRLERGQVYSIPTQLMRVESDALALAGAPALTDVQLLEAIVFPPGGGSPPAPSRCTFFQVIAPRLERQQMQRQLHVVDDRKHGMMISVYTRHWMDCGSLCCSSAAKDSSTRRLDLRRLCLDGHVGPFLQNLHSWCVEVGHTAIVLRRPLPRIREIPTVFPSMPDALEDAVPLLQLLDRPQGLDLGESADPRKVPFNLHYVTPAMQEAMDMLYAGGYVYENNKWLSVKDITIPGFIVFRSVVCVSASVSWPVVPDLSGPLVMRSFFL
jgi:hypothetical protein